MSAGPRRMLCSPSTLITPGLPLILHLSEVGPCPHRGEKKKEKEISERRATPEKSVKEGKRKIFKDTLGYKNKYVAHKLSDKHTVIKLHWTGGRIPGQKAGHLLKINRSLFRSSVATMPLHKSSSRTPRLDPTMISAPLGDFRHTMHIGRGGDAFGDTSFLSSHGPSSPNPKSAQPLMAATVETTDNQMNHNNEFEYAEDTGPNELRHSDSVSSFDLDLDLGPSILGDVLGVMDGLMMGSHKDNEEVFSSSKSTRDVMMSPRSAANELNERMRMESMTKEVSHRDEQLNEVNGMKSKGLRPKVRFSDKRDEIIGRQEIIEGLDVEVEEEMGLRPNKGMQEISGRTAYDPRQVEVVNRREDNSPSLSSSVSSEYEGVSPLDRRREDQNLSETDSEEEGANGQQGYTFEDEFDDEIGL